MGTTVVGFVLADAEHVLWFHVGDSRLYRWSSLTLKQVTVDHSAHAEWEKKGRVGSEPGKNIITRAIGPTTGAVAEIGWDKRQANDTYILCSDGLSDMISDEQISQVLASEQDVDRIAERLIVAANDAGGNDNVSVVVCRI